MCVVQKKLCIDGMACYNVYLVLVVFFGFIVHSIDCIIYMVYFLNLMATFVSSDMSSYSDSMLLECIQLFLNFHTAY